MSPSPSRSNTSARVARAGLGLALAAGLVACSDDTAPTCGPGDAAANGITATIAGETVRYAGFTSSVNNDCTIAGSPVISVTIQGVQEGGSAALALCLTRPDQLGAAPTPLTPSRVPPDPADRVQLFDVSAAISGGCTATLAIGALPAGTASFGGYCDDGEHPAGYALTLEGTAPVTVVCPGGQPTTMTATLAGTAAIVAE